MTQFTINEQFADAQIYAGGRVYAFVDGALTVEEEADAKRVRVFAIEQAHLEITEDGEAIEPAPAPEPAPTGFGRDANPAGEPEAEPEAPTSNEPEAPAETETPAAVDAPDSEPATDEPQDQPAADTPETSEGEAAATEAEDEAEAEAEAPQPERLNRAALVELAAAQGIATEGLTKAQIRAAIAGPGQEG